MADRAFSTLIQEVSANVPGCPQPVITREIRKSAIRTCERTLLWRHVEPTFNLSPGAYEYGYNKPANTDVHVIFDAMMNDQPLNKLTLEDALYLYPQWADLFSGYAADVAWSDTTKAPLNSNQFNKVEYNEANTYSSLEALDSTDAADLLTQESGSALLLETSTSSTATSAISLLYARADLSGNFNILDPTMVDGSEPRAICQVVPDKYIVLPMPDNSKTYTMRMFYALKPRRDADGMEEHILDELEDVIVHGALQQLMLMPNVTWSNIELASYHSRQYLFHLSERRARANLSNMRGSMTARSPRFA
jgi:hypothetical protein